MIIHNCAQHGEEWERLRIGIPTSSEFSKIVTTTGEPSKSETWKGYAYRLITERIKSRKLKSFQSRAMERGQIAEADAVDWYEFDRDVSTYKVGFITETARNIVDRLAAQDINVPYPTHDYIIGCSPDRLVGNDGLVEIKAPDPDSGEQVRYLVERRPQLRHKQQLQGQLLITGRKWVDIVCWDEDLPKCRVPVTLDPHFALLFLTQLHKFDEFLVTEMEKIITAGYKHVPEAKAMLRQQLLDTLAQVQSTTQ